MAQVNFITREVSFTEEELKKIAEAKKSVKVRMYDEEQTEEPEEATELVFGEVVVSIDEDCVSAFVYNPYTEVEEEFNV